MREIDRREDATTTEKVKLLNILVSEACADKT